MVAAEAGKFPSRTGAKVRNEPRGQPCILCVASFGPPAGEVGEKDQGEGATTTDSPSTRGSGLNRCPGQTGPTPVERAHEATIRAFESDAAIGEGDVASGGSERARSQRGPACVIPPRT